MGTSSSTPSTSDKKTLKPGTSTQVGEKVGAAPSASTAFTPTPVTHPSITDWESAWEDDHTPRLSLPMQRGLTTPTGSADAGDGTSGVGRMLKDASLNGKPPGSPGGRADEQDERRLNQLADETLKSGRAVMWEKSVSDPPLTVNVKHFSLLRVLGKGSFGKVVLVRKKAGLEVGGLYAMKVLRKSHLVKRRQIERTKTERRVLSMVSHVFIMKLHYAFQSSEKLYLVLDYCPGGELFFHLSRYRRFPERVARFYAAELTTAIGHLHSKGIIYRDLKPENVLLDADGHVKLGDFGLAKDNITHPTQGATSMCGTPEYMAPEVLLQRGHGFSVDWWGLGMLTFEMFTGLPPWYTTDKTKLFKRLKTAPLQIPSFVSGESGLFVSGLLERDPSARLGAKGVEAVQKHKFFGSVAWAPLLARRLTPPIRPCEGLKLPESRASPLPPPNSGNPTGERDSDLPPSPPTTNSNPVSVPGAKFSAADMLAPPSQIDQYSLSPDTIENATQNFDPAFTKLAVDTNDGLEGEPGSGSAASNDDLFPGFSYDQQVRMSENGRGEEPPAKVVT